MENHESLPPDTNNLPRNGHPKTILLSSNFTLFWRVFVPIFGTVFLSGLLVAFLLLDVDDYEGGMSLLWPRLILSVILLLWAGFIYRTLWQLKRVDADDTHLYVTNYWTSVRYPWQDLDAVEEKKRLGRRVVNFRLKAPGRFGNVISFLPGSAFDAWIQERLKNSN